MTPKLVTISGPLQGKAYLLEKEIVIGRDPSNFICINEQWISRQHCLIRKENEKLKIVDLGSHNGTFVNGVPVKERFLEHGDRIEIANSLFLLMLRKEDSGTAAAMIDLDEKKPFHRSTVRLQREDALYLQPDRIRQAQLSATTLARHLGALLKVSSAVMSVTDTASLEREVLDRIFEIVPAERGAILLVGDEPGSFSSIVGRDRASGSSREEGAVQVSRTIVEQVLREQAAILSNRLPKHEELGRIKSLQTPQVHSVLCLPLVVLDRTVGALYLDSRDPAVEFDEDQLELLTAISGMAAAALENARHLGMVEAENRRLQQDFNLEHNMVGEAPRMREVLELVAKVAPTDSTVLVFGESGTGKELVARAIHQNSPRTGKPFVKIDCATLSENLLESELFGHEKGAFTGAIRQKKGKLEVADGGTVFLDEIGELPPSLQSKLLRVLQDRELERLGGTRPIPIDIRLIAATNRNLAEEIKTGAFRQDLYYRLNVVSVTMPLLRERREDILLLANYFTAKYSRTIKRRVMGISPEATARLKNYDWPGNVRELENTIERAIVLGSTAMILPEDLPENLLEARPVVEGSTGSYHEAIVETKKQLILDAVKKTGGNYTEAARKLGLHPNYLHRLIRNLDLKADLKKL